MDRTKLLSLLGEVATIVQASDENIDIFAVGGVVSVLHLRGDSTRKTTHDIDFFAPSLREATVVTKAAQIVYQKNPDIPSDWLNEETSFWSDTPVPYDGMTFDQYLIKQAKEQNTVLFKAPGLRVFALPWVFALAGKLDRLVYPAIQASGRDIQEGHRWPYDIEDAAVDLHQYILRTQLSEPKAEPVPWFDCTIGESEINHLYLHYQPFAPVSRVPRQVLARLNETYRKKYGSRRDPIELELTVDTDDDDADQELAERYRYIYIH